MTDPGKKSERQELVNIIHTYIDLNKSKGKEIDPAYTWGRVYKMLKNESRINIFKEAKKKKLKIIDYLEQENMMGEACHIASILLSGDNK
jgi:hypothetical protein